MNPFFLTGSKAYGTPREDSDTDIAVFIAPDLVAEIEDIVQVRPNRGVLTCGKTQFLVFTDRAEFELWRKGTDDLIKLKPVTREFACAHFASLGLSGPYGEKHE